MHACASSARWAATASRTARCWWSRSSLIATPRQPMRNVPTRAVSIRPPSAPIKRLPRRVENLLVKAHVGADQVAAPDFAALHVGVGRADPLQCRRIAQLRGEKGRLRLEYLPELKDVVDEFQRRRGVHVPGEEIGIEHVPVRLRADQGADFLPRDDQSLGLERAERLPQRGTRYAETHQQTRLRRQPRSGRIKPDDDLAAEHGGQRIVGVAFARERAAGGLALFVTRARLGRCGGRRAAPIECRLNQSFAPENKCLG